MGLKIFFHDSRMISNKTPPILGSRLKTQKQDPQAQLGIEQFLQCLAQARLDNDITIDKVMQHLNFSKQVIERMEKGELNFVPYPLNYFFSKSYAEYLKVPFPDQYLMTHFKTGEKK